MTLRRTFVAAIAVVALAGIAAAVDARQRSFVASYGLDSNPCLIAQPCRTFAVAATILDPEGELIVLDSAGYGFVTITQPMSIISPGGVYAGISVFAATDGITINAPGANVRLINILINGQGGGTGIVVQNAAKVTVDGCSVTNMAADGLASASATARIVIRNSVFRDNGGAGVSVAGAVETTIDASHAERNGGAGFSLNSTKGTISGSVTNDNGSHGISLFAPATVRTIVAISDHKSADNAGSGLDASQSGSGIVNGSISRSAFSGNAQHGVRSSNTGQGSTRLIVADSQITGNTVSGVTAENPTAVVMLQGNVITNHPIGVQGIASGQVRSVNTNSITDNAVDTGAGYVTYLPQ